MFFYFQEKKNLEFDALRSESICDLQIFSSGMDDVMKGSSELFLRVPAGPLGVPSLEDSLQVMGAPPPPRCQGASRNHLPNSRSLWPISLRNFRILEGSHPLNNAYGGKRNSFRISSDSGLTPRVPLISMTQRQMLFMESSPLPWVGSQSGAWKHQACSSEPGEAPAASGLRPELASSRLQVGAWKGRPIFFGLSQTST